MATKEKEVKKNDKVTVYGTGKSKHMPQNKPYNVHVVAAENLIAKGYASATNTEGEVGGKGKGKKSE